MLTWAKLSRWSVIDLVKILIELLRTPSNAELEG